jgi:uncharacterized Tic20 family protein
LFGYFREWSRVPEEEKASVRNAVLHFFDCLPHLLLLLLLLVPLCVWLLQGVEPRTRESVSAQCSAASYICHLHLSLLLLLLPCNYNHLVAGSGAAFQKRRKRQCATQCCS